MMLLNGVKECIHQAHFKISKHMHNIFINAVNQKCYDDSLSILNEMYKRNFHWENLTVQLGQFATVLDTIDLVTKLFESLLNFGKTKSQKILLPEVTKLAKLLLVLPVTNATSDRSFSTTKCIKTYLRNNTSENRLNHCMLLHVHCKKTDQINMTEIANEFVGNDQTRLQTYGMF